MKCTKETEDRARKIVGRTLLLCISVTLGVGLGNILYQDFWGFLVAIAVMLASGVIVCGPVILSFLWLTGDIKICKT
jgi:hypothetical protein